MIRQARQIASVYMFSRKFGASSKPCSRIICSEYIPQPSTNSGALVSARVRLGCLPGDRQLEMVAGVRLVDAGVADRAVVVLAHRVRVVADRRRDDVDPVRVGVELGRVEVGRERDDVADVLRGRDDLDPLVVRDGHDVPLDEVPPGPDHDVAVGGRGRPRTSRGWSLLIRSTTVDSGDVRVDLPGRRDAGLGVERELLLADRQDRVGVEPVERAQADELVVALATERPVVGPVGQRALEPGPVVGDGRSWPRRRRACSRRSSAGPSAVLAGGHDLVEQARDLAGGLDLDRLPQADLGLDGPAARGVEERRRRLEPAGDRVEPLGQRGEVAGEQGEQRVADPVEGGRPALPDPDYLGVEDVALDVVDLEVALEPDRRPTARPDRSPRSRARWARSAAISPSTASRSPFPSRWSSVWMPMNVAKSG